MKLIDAFCQREYPPHDWQAADFDAWRDIREHNRRARFLQGLLWFALMAAGMLAAFWPQAKTEAPSPASNKSQSMKQNNETRDTLVAQTLSSRVSCCADGRIKAAGERSTAHPALASTEMQLPTAAESIVASALGLSIGSTSQAFAGFAPGLVATPTVVSAVGNEAWVTASAIPTNNVSVQKAARDTASSSAGSMLVPSSVKNRRVGRGGKPSIEWVAADCSSIRRPTDTVAPGKIFCN